jgi:hypothetical protein
MILEQRYDLSLEKEPLRLINCPGLIITAQQSLPSYRSVQPVKSSLLKKPTEPCGNSKSAMHAEPRYLRLPICSGD